MARKEAKALIVPQKDKALAKIEIKKSGDVRIETIRKLKFVDNFDDSHIKLLYTSQKLYDYFPPWANAKLVNLTKKMYEADMKTLSDQLKTQLLRPDRCIEDMILVRSEYKEMLNSLYFQCLKHVKLQTALAVLKDLMNLDGVLKEEKPQIKQVHFHFDSKTPPKEALDTANEILGVKVEVKNDTIKK